VQSRFSPASPSGYNIAAKEKKGNVGSDFGSPKKNAEITTGISDKRSKVSDDA
jgi:hypothetical protein